MVVNAAIILKNHKRSNISIMLDVIFGLLHFGIWFLVLYYKITLHSLINMCQPCHIALLVQGLGVVWGEPHGTIIGIISLPLLVGPIGALLVPALDGLDQPYEELFFFIQHYLLLITPIFLLLRNNYCSYKLVTFRSLVYANWKILVLHWFIFAVSFFFLFDDLLSISVLNVFWKRRDLFVEYMMFFFVIDVTQTTSVLFYAFDTIILMCSFVMRMPVWNWLSLIDFFHPSLKYYILLFYLNILS